MWVEVVADGHTRWKCRSVIEGGTWLAGVADAVTGGLFCVDSTRQNQATKPHTSPSTKRRATTAYPDRMP